MKITLDSNPSDAPCCLKIVAEDGRDTLIQTDWDFPGVASSFGWSLRDVQADPRTAYFNRFSLSLPADCVADCSHEGQCDEDVAHWAGMIVRPPEITKDALEAELKEYGAWETDLFDDTRNWHRLIWIAAGNLKDSPCEHSGTDGTIDCQECGLKAGAFIQAARQWLDDHDGAQTDDPGYFAEGGAI